jgi:SAM-dependent methyltransferase
MSIAEANVGQAEYWSSGLGGQHWVAYQELMDRQLAPLGDAAIEAAAVKPGESVLDVGCGCGATTLALAELTGPAGRVLGLDISTSMTEVAGHRLLQAGHAHAAALVADAQVASSDLLGVPFDVVFSRFGVMFFADPAAAFVNLRAQTKSGGRLAFVCWQPSWSNPMFSDLGRALAEVFPDLPSPDPLAPGPFAFADPDRVRSILGNAGWADVEIVPCERSIQLFGTTDFETAFDGSLRIGGAARLLDGADAETIAKVHQAARRVLEGQWGPNGAVLSAACWIVSARNK